jgi:hypothetical protein
LPIYAIVEVFLSFAPIREALGQSGTHPVVTQFRLLMQSRRVAASVEPLIEVVCAAARELWGHSHWFLAFQSAERTFAKLVATFDLLPDDAGKPVSTLFHGTWTTTRMCSGCRRPLGPSHAMSGPMIELRAVHHGAQALSVNRHESVNRAFQGPLYACSCGVSREA